MLFNPEVMKYLKISTRFYTNKNLNTQSLKNNY